MAEFLCKLNWLLNGFFKKSYKIIFKISISQPNYCIKRQIENAKTQLKTAFYELLKNEIFILHSKHTFLQLFSIRVCY